MDKIFCGGFYIDENSLEIVTIDGQPTLRAKLADVGVDGVVDADLDMNGYSILTVQRMTTNSSHPVHIGATVLPDGTQGVKLVCANDNSLAIVTPDSVDTYARISAADPEDADNLATKRYVDEALDRLREELGK